VRARFVLAVWASASAACAHAEIPYDLAHVERREKPIHEKRIAVLPFLDGRTRDEGPDDADRFVYQGVELEHTDLSDLRGSPLARVTELVGRHLAQSHVFRQVILVSSSEQAPEADLLMSGRVRRMRGYVEADAPSKDSGRPENERLVLAEVVLGDIEVREARAPGRLLFAADVGWSVQDRRTTGAGAIDPWSVLGEALHRTVQELIEGMEKADLSGGTLVKGRVELAIGEGGAGPYGDLDRAPPEGWRFVHTATASEPTGWNATDARCDEIHLEQSQTLKFHRILGPYRPTVRIWACPSDLVLEYDAMEEFPARYLGARGDGSNYFGWTVGESNWPNALEEIGLHLALRPPPQRYVFQVGKR
jgi:hypothetical protein